MLIAMLLLIRRLRGVRPDREQGIALAAAIGIAALLMIMTMTGLTFSVSALTKAGTDSNGAAATAAAYAGISDYQSRLTNDNTYQQYGDPNAPFSLSTGSTSLVLPAANANGSPANPAFGWGLASTTHGTWATIPGAPSTTGFRYEVDNSNYSSQGIIRILATGRAGNQTRSFIANVRQNGFLNYLYFTDFETQDPSLIGVTPTSTCAKYYAARVAAGVLNTCGGLIQFRSGETVNGPIDSNDALDICGGTFNGTVTSNYATSPYYLDCGSATFNQGVPTFGGQLPMPSTNSSMKNETRGDLLASTVPRPGCLYTGPTSILFNGDGTITVRSPWSKWMNITGSTPPAGMATSQCGTIGTGANQLGSPGGDTFTMPTQNLIFVQSVPSVVGDANYWPTTGTSSSPSGTGNACVTNGNDLGYPLSTSTGSGSTLLVTTETTLQTPANTNYYGCRAGDAFVQGTVKGQVTVAADNYVWITGNLTYSDMSSDVLGLVGQNAVWVWNPDGTTKLGSGSTSSVKNLLTDSGRTIDAAILSVAHTFQVQNYNVGSSRGQLTVVGAIAQEFRGTVGQSPAGYLKNYTYDSRFRSIAPPKFLQAVSTTYGVSQLAGVPPAFSSTGASQ
jgi:hypothetical protein